MSDARTTNSVLARLRAEQENQAARLGEEDADDRVALARDAADEIERLRGALDEIEAAYIGLELKPAAHEMVRIARHAIHPRAPYETSDED